MYVAAFETTDGVPSCPRIKAARGRLQADGAIPPAAPLSFPAGQRGLTAVRKAAAAAVPEAAAATRLGSGDPVALAAATATSAAPVSRAH